jgi:hypothetical protein
MEDKYVLEALTFTLAIFKEEARRYVEFWRPLKAMKARQEYGAKCRDYHTHQLGILFEQIRKLQQNTSDALKACPIVIDGKTYTRDILVPILCFIVDAQAYDYLTGRYFNRNQGIHCLHCPCLTKTDDIDKPDFNWKSTVKLKRQSNDNKSLLINVLGLKRQQIVKCNPGKRLLLQ